MKKYKIYSNLESFKIDYFDPNFWRDLNKIEKVGEGRSDAYLIRHEDQQWVLKEYLRGGKISYLLSDRYFYFNKKQIRPIKEWEVTNYLFTCGLPVARPIALLVKTGLLSYRASLVTEYIPYSKTLLDVIRIRNNANKEIWVAVGQMIKKFHEHGLSHPDINIRNILVDNLGRTYLIDFDKAVITYSQRKLNSNLLRLKRSIVKNLSSTKGIEKAYDHVMYGYKINSIA
jgi:3-deoxy-D-manno-octulosonic acid kinase